ncbi:hypothetical protein GALMADRAFT_374597 [Galerina marginata CBS 339.88]|uniref:Uncharacterized protein n=1 Tax=Galerina marginata (strain CBS 339.88) TaxID=685588 RepID=A0A067TQY7_GALM3|nr:hypothetical protein GALMADRAFT_374597 [Galerina marginata CBS 339.88]
MSEEDRAAKAARAKALLKKRQQKKAADSAAANVVDSGVASPVNPPRTFSPTPSEPVAEDGRDLGDVFSKDTSDTSWLSSLPRVTSPPPPAPPHANSSVRRVSASSPKAVLASSDRPTNPLLISEFSGQQDQLDALLKENETLAATVSRLQKFETTAQQAEASLEAERKRVEALTESYQKLQEDTEIALQNEHQTVSLLVTEKAHLTAELQRRDDFESKVQALDDQLGAERTQSETLSGQVSRLKIELQNTSQRAKLSEDKEKELTERYKEQERHLQIVSASAAESRKEADDFKRKLRELEEQIQSDDRVERLESSLKNTQDRAAELEFQLTKLKQAHTTLKTERDSFESKSRGAMCCGS